MRILLTGAAGFVGSHLTDALIAAGHSVIGVDNLVTGRRENVAHLLDSGQFVLMESDASRPLSFDGDLDWVMHFASPASPPKYLDLPLETLRVNGEGTRHLLDLAVQKNAKFFLASTSEIYGDPDVHPQPEDYWGHVSCTGPRSVYDEGKRYAETLTHAYHRCHGLSTRVIRIFNTYGPRMDPGDGRVVTNFIMQALTEEEMTIYGDGSQTRSFQYVSDLIDGIMKLMQVEYHEPVNLGNPEEYTVLELALLIRGLCDSQAPIVFRPLPQDDPRQRRPSIEIAKDLLGWHPKVHVQNGLMKTIDSFQQTAAENRKGNRQEVEEMEVRDA